MRAGFDAHRKDDINFNFVGVREHDYAWVTEQIVQVANRVCGGRVVSVLEGGYRVQGKDHVICCVYVTPFEVSICMVSLLVRDKVWFSGAVL